MSLPNLLVLVSPDGEAMHRDAAESAAAWRASYDVLVLGPPDARARFEALGVAFEPWRPAGFLGMGRAVAHLRRTAERRAPAIVHAHGFPAAAVALGTFPLSLARRTVVTFHDPQRDRELPRKLVERRLPGYLQRAAGVVATYAPLARALETRLGLAAESIGVIPHGVEPLPDAPPLARPAARPGPIVGWRGSLTADRAWETAIDALVRVRATLPEARLVVAGGGRAQQFVKAYARQQRVADAVDFRGPISAAETFAAIDLLIVPISRDAQPHAVLEALVWGVPVVAANVGALADALGSVETGWLVPDDAEGFARGIADAWSAIDAAWAGAAAQRDAARERYARERTLAHYRARFETIASDGAVPATVRALRAGSPRRADYGAAGRANRRRPPQ
jgi:glycosyltransferase involved in cell wall biosynthesis